MNLDGAKLPPARLAKNLCRPINEVAERLRPGRPAAKRTQPRPCRTNLREINRALHPVIPQRIKEFLVGESPALLGILNNDRIELVRDRFRNSGKLVNVPALRSEEHTSELQSRENLVCRLLLEKKKNS